MYGPGLCKRVLLDDSHVTAAAFVYNATISGIREELGKKSGVRKAWVVEGKVTGARERGPEEEEEDSQMHHV
jgi:hypothetical protein